MIVSIVALAPMTGCIGNTVAGLGQGSGGGGGTAGEGDGGDSGLFNGHDGAVESTGLRRLTVTEYANTARDLLDTKLSLSAMMIPDDVAGGFDNNAAALGMSAVRLQGFQVTAEALGAELAASATQLAKLAPCAAGAQSAACLQRFVTSFGQRAWRRPLATDEVSAITALASANNGDTYPAQVSKATTTLLVSPYFLYKVELDDEASNVNSYELATRLAYFLWSSAPDDALLAAAADKSLLKDDVFSAQVARMLKDRRSSSLSQNFGDQYLQLRALSTYAPDAEMFPAFNEKLRQAMLAQSHASFNALVTGDISLPEYLNGKTTFVNNTLADFYGMPSPQSDDLVRVVSAERGPLLTQAAILASTSGPKRTSIILRGKYVLTNLLCAPLPAPPQNVGELTVDGNAITQRQQLANHARNPSCAVCHNQMDPYGFVLEPFDAIGASRTLDEGEVIDSSATLPDGTKVANAAEMSAKLAANPRVPACVVQNLLSFAIGRTLVFTDSKQVNGLTAEFVNKGQKVDQLILDIVSSPLFRQRN